MSDLIGLGYRAGAGKDTVASILAADGYTRFGFADAIRDVLADLDPFINPVGRRLGPLLNRLTPEGEVEPNWGEAKKSPEVRQLLQRLGSSCRLHIHQGVWVGATMVAVDAHLKAGGKAVITDVRHVNEAQAILKRGGAVVRVDRPGIPVLDHETEHALDDFDGWTHVITNDGDLRDLTILVSGFPSWGKEVGDETGA